MMVEQVFNKNDIGSQVTCQKYGIGIIFGISTEGGLMCRFPNCRYPEHLWYYNPKGDLEGFEGDAETKITLVASAALPMIDLPKIVINDNITTLTPELLAEAFWLLDSSEQARFYNHLNAVADFHFPFQLQAITDEEGLTLDGRRVMQSIGDYSHWGLVPKLCSDGVVR